MAALDNEDHEHAARVAAEAKSRSVRAQRHHGVRGPQRPLFQALVETGAHWSELTLTTWTDLDEANAVLRLRTANTKSRKQRRIPVRRAFLEDLVALKPVHAASRKRPVVASDRILPTPEGANWGKPTNDVALRGTAATSLARRGVSMAVTQRLLGHKTVEMTAKVYTHLGLEDLRGAVEGVSEPRRECEAVG